jgi:hypothetical protein
MGAILSATVKNHNSTLSVAIKIDGGIVFITLAPRTFANALNMLLGDALSADFESIPIILQRENGIMG